VTVSRELLMRYHDAEVSEAEARLVEAALEQEPALLEELEAYAELGQFVRVSSDSRAVQSFDISESVMAAIAPMPKRVSVSRPPARVHSLLPRIATWVSLGAAIAAGSVLVARSWSAPASPVGGGGAHAVAGAHSPASPSAAPDLSAAPELAAALQAEEEPKLPPATIESVDFGGNTGSVFVVSTDSSETPVVWMPDDGEPDEDNEDRSESL
jgi:anti-sigma factor RsiW